MLTAERLRELLHYDPETGIFTWKVRTSSRARAGDTAGGLNGGGYIAIRIDGTKYLAHRLAWLWVKGEWPEFDIDHRYGIKDDNRWSELRPATKSQNHQNMRKRSSQTTVRSKGVCRHKNGRYRASIYVDGKQIHLGYHETEALAEAAYAQAAEKHFGEFARTE